MADAPKTNELNKQDIKTLESLERRINHQIRKAGTVERIVVDLKESVEERVIDALRARYLQAGWGNVQYDTGNQRDPGAYIMLQK